MASKVRVLPPPPGFASYRSASPLRSFVASAKICCPWPVDALVQRRTCNMPRWSGRRKRSQLELVMRLLTSAIFVAGTLLALRATSAQTYDPSYPVCMHLYGVELGDRMDCTFTSLDQCAATARGLPATCLINPYYARKLTPVRPYRPWAR